MFARLSVFRNCARHSPPDARSRFAKWDMSAIVLNGLDGTLCWAFIHLLFCRSGASRLSPGGGHFHRPIDGLLRGSRWESEDVGLQRDIHEDGTSRRIDQVPPNA